VRLQGQDVWPSASVNSAQLGGPRNGTSANGTISPVAQPRRSSPFSSIIRFLDKTLVIADVEIRKLRHDPTELFTRVVQPLLWLLVFGQVFTRTRAIPTGDLSYIDFMAPGVLAQSILFTAIFYGIAIIWERDLGIVYKYLVSPTPRTALVLGKGLSAGVRALTQAIMIYVVAVLLGVKMNWSALALLGVLATVVLGATLFSTFSLVIACLVKTRERFMGIGQVMTMPLFFASNAIYPLSMMPGWLQTIARFNPLTYQVDALRGLMIAQGQSVYGIGVDLLVLLAVDVALVALGGWLYPNVAM
jgi:ABC-2 type transport system permease protein